MDFSAWLAWDLRMAHRNGQLPPLQPTSDRTPDQVLRIAHRGASGDPRPYGATSLERVAALGAHLVEFDLQVTCDDKLVATHDPHLSAAGSRVVTIREHSSKELTDSTPDGIGLPSAADVLRSARGAGLGLYIDIKTLTPASAEWLIDQLQDQGTVDQTILASSEVEILKLCAATAPQLPRAILYRSPDEDPIAIARSAEATFVHPCWEMLPSPHELLAGPWLERVRAHHLGVITWHEERRPVLEALCSLGVDGVCTDEPALLTSVATAAPT